MGRNVAFQYDGPEISVRPQSQYRIEGFFRTRSLNAARFCVSAHYLDAERQPLPFPTHRTPYTAQSRESDWIAFELNLPAAPEEARFLGLVAWILQEETWNLDQSGQGIPLVDVEAEAWVDDIGVYRLPRVEISTRTPGSILDPRDASLWVTVADTLDPQVTGHLTVVSADGKEIIRRQIDSIDRHGEAERVDVSGLRPGLYDARLEVAEKGRTIVSRSIRFLKQASLTQAPRHSRSFGTVLDAANRADLCTESAMLVGHAARSVKIPVWPAAGRSNADASHDQRTLEQCYHELARNQFSLTGVLSLPEAEARHSALLLGGSPGPMASLGDRLEIDFAEIAGPALNVFRSWQVGNDGRSAYEDLTSFKAIESRLRTVLHESNSIPRIAIPLTPQDDGKELPLAAQHVTLAVKNASDLYDLAERIDVLREKGVGEVSVFVPPLPADQFAREPRLADWARRVLRARHAGADVVYIPQPWTVRHAQDGSTIEPEEEYLLFKTIAGPLGDSTPGPVIEIAEDVRCLTFRGDTGSTVAIWDEAPPKNGRVVAIQLGAVSRQVDLWGNSAPLGRDEAGRSLVAISAMPVLIDHVDNDVIAFSSSVSLEPAIVESGTKLVSHEIVIDCSAQLPESGEGTLISLAEIEVSPRSFSFSACAGEPVRIPIQVRYAHNEPAGKKKFTARIALSKSGYQFEIPLIVEVRMSNVHVNGRAILEGSDLVLRHTVQNQSQQVVSFRGVAAVPGRQRQYRPIANLQPGETQTIEYRYPDAIALIGRKVNLSLRESNDGPRRHNLEVFVP